MIKWSAEMSDLELCTEKPNILFLSLDNCCGHIVTNRKNHRLVDNLLWRKVIGQVVIQQADTASCRRHNTTHTHTQKERYLQIVY